MSQQIEQALQLERTYIAWGMLLDGQAPSDIARWTQVPQQTLVRLQALLLQ